MNPSLSKVSKRFGSGTALIVSSILILGALTLFWPKRGTDPFQEGQSFRISLASLDLGRATAIAMSPSGDNLFIGALSGDVWICNLQTKDCERLCRIEQKDAILGGITCLAVSPSGRSLLIGSSDRIVRLVDLSNPGKIVELVGHPDGPIRSVAFARNEEIAASGCNVDRGIRVWDLKRGRERMALRNGKTVDSLAFSPDQRYLAVTQFNKVAIWDLKTKTKTLLDHVHRSRAHVLAWLPDETIIAGDGFGKVCLWNPETRKCVNTIEHHTPFLVDHQDFSPDGNYYVLAESGKVEVWSVEDMSRVKIVKTKPGAPFATIHPSRPYLVIVELFGDVLVEPLA